MLLLLLLLFLQVISVRHVAWIRARHSSDCVRGHCRKGKTKWENEMWRVRKPLICTSVTDHYSNAFHWFCPNIVNNSQTLLSKGFGDVPWYVYVARGGVALLIGSLATKFAADAMKKIESSPEPSSGPNMIAISNKVNPIEPEWSDGTAVLRCHVLPGRLVLSDSMLFRMYHLSSSYRSSSLSNSSK